MALCGLGQPWREVQRNQAQCNKCTIFHYSSCIIFLFCNEKNKQGHSYFCSVQVGFEMIDVFAESVGITMNRVHCKAVFGEGMFTVL